MRRCSFQVHSWDEEEKTFKTTGKKGWFHQWGTESREVDFGKIEKDTVAICEDENGEVFTCFPGTIEFDEPYALKFDREHSIEFKLGDDCGPLSREEFIEAVTRHRKGKLGGR